MKINNNCRFFKGDIPCIYNKKENAVCDNCTNYDPIKTKILIIKLGAAGDVIRTTPILKKLKQEYPNSEITWLTWTPDLVPSEWVDRIWKFELKRIVTLQMAEFDLLINLDKDLEACALTKQINATEKKGFILDNNNRCSPVNRDSEHKFMTGIFDDLNKTNTKNYIKEIFEICGHEFNGEKYILSNFAHEGYKWDIPKDRTVVGLNTGCGSRWTSRLWAEENWIELTRKLQAQGKYVLLLGGPDEHEKNTRLAKATGAEYLGHFPLKQFINLVDQCDLVITAVTMAMHIVIGLEKKMVLFNNIFNKHEFELYGNGQILEPEFACDCFFANICPNDCMQYIYVDKVLSTCEQLLEE